MTALKSMQKQSSSSLGTKLPLVLTSILFSLFFLSCQIGKQAIREVSSDGQQSEVSQAWSNGPNPEPAEKRVLLWDNYPHGVVSLLDMLEFAAKDYVQIAHQFGLILGTHEKNKADPEATGKALSELLTNCFRLGMMVTRDQIGELIKEMLQADPSSVKVRMQTDMLRIEQANIDPQRFCHHIETIYSVFRSELGSINFRSVPKEKSKYCDPKWLFDSPIQKNFPSAWNEFQSAGRCFAYGENTACAFHLSRALEWGLKSLAVKLGKRFDRNNWEKHIEDIDKELKARYGAAGPRTPEEKFYSEAATQFGNMKVAWRNPTMHIEAHYDESQGKYLLDTIEQFITYLANNGLVEAQKP